MSSEQVELLLAAVAVVIPAAVTIYVFVAGGGPLRSTLKTDAEILSNLAPETDAHATMSELVGREVAALDTQSRGVREIGIAAMAALSAGGLGYLTVVLAFQGFPQVLGAVGTGFLAASCVYGVYESARKVPREGDKPS